MSPVVLIMIDGLRPDAIALADCPHLKQKMAQGSHTLKARSVMPSITLPCHTSIFHSVPPSRHGITTNDWHPMARPVPGITEIAKVADKKCVFFTNWEQLRDLSRPGSLYYSFMIDNSYTDPNGDHAVADAAVDYFAKNDADFAFIYLGTVDTYGHYHGWMSDEYLAQVAVADAALGRVLNALSDNHTVIIQADHGGHERDHGTDSPEDMTIPWLAAGSSIRAGHEIQAPVSLLDTAPTIARLLGLTNIPADWEGRCIEEIFVDDRT